MSKDAKGHQFLPADSQPFCPSSLVSLDYDIPLLMCFPILRTFMIIKFCQACIEWLILFNNTIELYSQYDDTVRNIGDNWRLLHQRYYDIRCDVSYLWRRRLSSTLHHTSVVTLSDHFCSYYPKHCSLDTSVVLVG